MVRLSYGGDDDGGQERRSDVLQEKLACLRVQKQDAELPPVRNPPTNLHRVLHGAPEDVADPVDVVTDARDETGEVEEVLPRRRVLGSSTCKW